MPDPNRLNNNSKMLSAVSRSSSLFATTHFNAVPSKSLIIAVQACLSSFKLSCSKCNLMTSTQVSMHPSESSLNYFGFLKVFLGLPPPLTFESVILVAKASSVPFIFSQVIAHVMTSGPTLLFVVESPGPLSVFAFPLFLIFLKQIPPPPGL